MRGTVSICPGSAWASPRPMVLTGPRRSDGSRTTRPRRAPTRAAPASSSSWRASSSVPVLASRSVSSCNVVRSETQPASRSWMKAPGAEGTSDRDPAVCAETGTVGSIPATFGRCGALMASGFPTSAFCRIASQTPMSFCAAISASACTRSTTCTRTSEAMSSIVPTGFMVSGRPPSWPKNAPEGNYLRSTGRARTGVFSG